MDKRSSIHANYLPAETRIYDFMKKPFLHVNRPTLYGQHKKATETQSSTELIPELHRSQFCF